MPESLDPQRTMSGHYVKRAWHSARLRAPPPFIGPCFVFIFNVPQQRVQILRNTGRRAVTRPSSTLSVYAAGFDAVTPDTAAEARLCLPV